jgi:TPP-dependent pyruvate/acetoin dehydrogenase alpha subunit
MKVLRDTEKVTDQELADVDARIMREIDEATDIAEVSPMPEPEEALRGVYADPPTVDALWFRKDVQSAVATHERPASWGTYDG